MPASRPPPPITWAVWLTTLGACSAITTFDRGKAVESTDLLCSDGIDNDEDGLTDCQDWKCLGQRACCDVPTIDLDEDFGAAGCDCSPPPDPTEPPLACRDDADCLPSDKWERWGAPGPHVCGDGGLISCKLETCYDVGLLGRPTVLLEPGVQVDVTFSGQPERRGRLTAALTFQQEAPRVSMETCLPITPIQPTVAVEMIGSEDGDTIQIVALFGDAVVGSLSLDQTRAAHDVSIRVQDDGTVKYAVDDREPPLVSGTDQIVPTAAQPVRLALYGRGVTGRLQHARLRHGSRCEDPAAWQRAGSDAEPPGASLDAPSSGWDNLAVFRPSVVSLGKQGLALAYSGCADAGFSTCSPTLGAAAVTFSSGGPFPPKECGFVSTSGEGYACAMGAFNSTVNLFGNYFNYFDADIRMVAGSGLMALVSQPPLGQPPESPQSGIKSIVWQTPGADQQEAWRHYMGDIDPGPPGSWDAFTACCASSEISDDGKVTVWYSGRESPDGPWRIGMAVADVGDKQPFTKYAGNPILGEGPSGSPDQRGASDPDVIWDEHRKLYRMWYVAHDPLDQTSIALAVSTDGRSWRRYPSNPILRAASAGLVSIANPTVLQTDNGLRMWVEGERADLPGVRIFELRNTGTSRP